MRIGILALIALVAVSIQTSAVAAQGVQDDDARFSASGLSDAIAGQTLEFFDGSLASYADSAAYEYRYRPDEPPFVGKWRATDESEVCVTFNNGFSRCDVIVRSGDRLVLITEDGLRFPVRSVRPGS